MDGVRTTKIAGNEKHEYVTQNGKVVRELVTNKTTGAFIRCLDFLYDESGKPFAMRRYWDASLSSYGTYHYVLNAQGDVVQINYQGGEVKATYTYDAWGRVLTADGELAAMNPIRYRGYYYDTDTGFYYLQSRYYDPIIKRFLNADSYESTGQGFIGTNMFAYCNNNPVKYIDFTGSLAIGIGIGIGIGIEEIIELVLGFTALCFGIAVIDEYTNSRGHSGTIVCSVQPIEEEKENVAVAEATSEPRIYSYWEAERVGNSVIVGRGLTLSEASLRIASGQNIMCRDKGAAKVILIVNNYSNAVGPEKHAENYYYHYHPNRHSHTHIWFYGEARDTRKKGNIYETIA